MVRTISSLLALGLFASFAAAQSAPGEQYIPRVAGMSEYRVRKTETDSLGMTHTWADQLYHGIPVFGGEAIVHLKRDGSLASIDEEALTNVVAPFSPRYSMNDAIATAENLALFNFGNRGEERSEARLYVIRYGGRDRLAYQVQVGTVDTKDGDVLPVYWVDAVDGQAFWLYDNIRRELGQGPSLYFGTTWFFVERSAPFFYMQDFSRNMQCLSARDTRNDRYDVIDPDLLFFAPEHVGAIDCWFNGQVAYEYFRQVHSWTGMDGNNGPGTDRLLNNNRGFTMVCDYGRDGTKNARNAFWNPAKKQVFFGGAEGWVGVREFVSCDTVGHEMGHAVVEALAGITSGGESGPMNESIADVFGALVERFRDGVTSPDTWLIGEDVMNDGTPAFRDMINPENINQPDHMSEYVNFAGDVHKNNGIPNRAFTLAALGGTHSNSPASPTAGIGIDNAAKVWFRALRYHMGAITTFNRGRRATIKAAEEIFGAGSVEAYRVRRAWELCGV